MAFIGKKVKDLTIGEVLMAVVIGWILVAIWQRVLDNLAYNYLGMDKSSTYDTVIVALTITITFVIYITMFNLISLSGRNTGIEAI